MPEERQREVHDFEGSDQDQLQGKEMQKGQMVVWGGLTNSREKKRSYKQRRKGKIYPFECRVPKNSKERKEGMDLTEVEDINKKWQEYTEELYKKIFMTQIITMV